MSRPALIVFPLAKAESYVPRGVEICISITNPNAPLANVSPQFAAVLRLCFTDIALPSPWDFDVLFDRTHAAAIKDFVSQWPYAERIVIHCVAGNGRSPGVALGLSDIHGWPTEELEAAHPLFNTWVRAELGRQ